MGPQHCVCVVDVRKITTDTYTDTRCFTDCNIKIWLNIQFYAYLYGSMGPQHCVRIVDVRKITMYIYTNTQCFTDQWGHYFTIISTLPKKLCFIPECFTDNVSSHKKSISVKIRGT
jgi:hypothetical protein